MSRFLSVLTVLALVVPRGRQDLAVTIKEVEPFPYCAIAHKGPYTDMGTVIGDLVGGHGGARPARSGSGGLWSASVTTRRPTPRPRICPGMPVSSSWPRRRPVRP